MILVICRVAIIMSVMNGIVGLRRYSQNYSPITGHFNLSKVAIFIRHGDRSQISKTLGPKIEENSQIKTLWHEKMVKRETLKFLSTSALIPAGF